MSEHEIIIFVAFFLGLVIKGVAGFGDPLFISPILSFFYPTQVITPVMLIISLPLNFYFFIKNIREIRIKEILPILAFVLIGAIIGVTLLSYIDSYITKVILGIVIVIIGIEMFLRLNSSTKIKPSFITQSVVSLLSGISSGLYSINMFILAYFEKTSKNRHDFRANACCIFFVDGIVRLILYINQGLFTSQTLSILIIALPAACLGFITGQLLDRRLDERKVKLITIIIF
ncbi:MAG: sulfite exporter TauE/SafE family protein, partial [Brevinema sp.]